MSKIYKAITYFEDAKDNNRPYNVGDIYPREGLEVSDERIHELSTPFNARNEVIIEEVLPKRTKKEEYNDD